MNTIESLISKYNGSYRFIKPKLFKEQCGEELFRKVNQIPVEPFSLKVFCFVNNIPDYPKCKMCENKTKFNTSKKQFASYCSNQCRYKDKEIQNKRNQTNLNKYGHTNVFASTYGKQKIKETLIKKYNVENYTQTQEYKDRIKTGDIKRKKYSPSKNINV